MRTGKLKSKILAFALPLTLIPFVLTALAVYYFIIRAYNVQTVEEQNKRLAEAVVYMRKEQEAARKDVELLANLPAVAEYLEAVSYGSDPPSVEGATKEAAARTLLHLFFQQNPYYLQLSLVDAQGRERIKFSKRPGQPSLGSVKGENFFRRTLIGGPVQMPVESVQADRFASRFTRRVRREKFSGIVVLDLNTAVFERSLRPLLASHRLSTVVFDDRGLVFAKVLAGPEEEGALKRIDLAGEAKVLLAKPALEVSSRTVSAGRRELLFSILPAEKFINFVEPLPGEHWFLGVLRPKDLMSAEMGMFQAIFFVILMAAVGAVLWATTHYSRRVTGPLEQVAEATTKIGAGQFDIDLRIATGDEIENLAVAVRQMAEDLKRYQTELVRSAKLATIGEMASEISHEIQNRISGLSLWTQYLDAEMAPDDPKREYLGEMKQGLQEFMELLAALKQFYRTPVLYWADADLNQLVRQSLRYVQERIEARKIAVDLHLDPDLPLVRCDREKVKSVIINLLVNAVDAVGETGQIRIRTGAQDRADGQTVMLSVSDNGHGIAAEDLPRIFYPFYSTKASGSGFGLAIASSVVSAHGGKIEVESRVGEGTTFTVILKAGERPLEDKIGRSPETNRSEV